MEKLIYIADDEENIREIVKSFLVKEGYEVMVFSDGKKLMDAFQEKKADMLILDITMPNMDGFSVCMAVRQISKIPIIFISARDTEPDKIAGLTLGSDDYIPKPFSPMELVARVKSLFRRIDFDRVETPKIETIEVGDITIYPEGCRVDCKGINLEFTTMEFNFIHYLAKNRNRAIGREELLNKVWGYDCEVGTRATDDMMKRIRKKLTTYNSNLEIESIRGLGYKIS